MTYYIRHYDNPRQRADFFIAHDVGALQEEDDQNGLAHFLEHMAFNGTKNLPGKKMIEYLERNGVKFGADLNAYTSYDETCYNLDNVPTANPATIDTALLILHDWSQFISLEPQEINNERGVNHGGAAHPRRSWMARHGTTQRPPSTEARNTSTAT